VHGYVLVFHGEVLTSRWPLGCVLYWLVRERKGGRLERRANGHRNTCWEEVERPAQGHSPKKVRSKWKLNGHEGGETGGVVVPPLKYK